MSITRINNRWAETHGDDRLHYGERFIATNQPRRTPWHWLIGCRGHVESDASGLWFQCGICGRVAGFVSRAELDHQFDHLLSGKQA